MQQWRQTSTDGKKDLSIALFWLSPNPIALFGIVIAAFKFIHNVLRSQFHVHTLTGL